MLFDVKIFEYIHNARFKNMPFAEYVERFLHAQANTDDSEQKMEQALFSLKFMAQHKTDDAMDEKLRFIERLEEDLVPVLADMEYVWVPIHKKRLLEIGERMTRDIQTLEEEIFDTIGERFNINSAKQVQYILFEKLKIPTTKKIKTGFSVDNEALVYIAEKYDIARLILEHRTLTKLKGTYVEGLQSHINKKTNRIHTTFLQTQASTGRLASENPNLQNIPTGSGYAGEIKACFEPTDKNYSIMVADYSQMELRVLANLSGDVELLAAFNQNEDIHAKTAKFLFGENTTITGELRRMAKSVNFGVVYGITGFWLSKMIHASPKEGSEYINRFFEKYPQVRTYFDGILEGARKNGYVETYFGRRRYIGGINDANATIRAWAEREATNMPVQGTAADIVKLAMISLHKKLQAEKLKSRMILQVHDELVFEVANDEKEYLQKTLLDIMENVVGDFKTKLLVDIHTGWNWQEAKL